MVHSSPRFNTISMMLRGIASGDRDNVYVVGRHPADPEETRSACGAFTGPSKERAMTYSFDYDALQDRGLTPVADTQGVALLTISQDSP